MPKKKEACVTLSPSFLHVTLYLYGAVYEFLYSLNYIKTLFFMPVNLLQVFHNNYLHLGMPSNQRVLAMSG